MSNAEDCLSEDRLLTVLKEHLSLESYASEIVPVNNTGNQWLVSIGVF